MLFICYANCSTCKKAQKWLDEHSIAYTIRDIKTNRPSPEELRSWHTASGFPLKRFFNTSGEKYRELGLKDRLAELTEAEQYDLLGTDGMLVKRPLLIGEGFVFTGFREPEWAAKLLNG